VESKLARMAWMEIMECQSEPRRERVAEQLPADLDRLARSHHPSFGLGAPRLRLAFRDDHRYVNGRQDERVSLEQNRPSTPGRRRLGVEHVCEVGLELGELLLQRRSAPGKLRARGIASLSPELSRVGVTGGSFAVRLRGLTVAVRLCRHSRTIRAFDVSFHGP
jgi:hypothetical protein